MKDSRIEGEAARVLRVLNRDGVAVTSVERLLGASPLFRQLADAVEARQRELSNALEQARAAAANTTPGTVQKEWGTHAKGARRRQPAYLFKEGNTTRSSDEQMAEIVPASEWVTSTGPPGTIITADTRGFHKGGLARMRDRIMYTCMFTSSTALPELFDRPSRLLLPIGRAQAFGLQA